MMVLITYDVNTSSMGGAKRLHQVAKECLNYGQRVQNSVFECLIEPFQLSQLKHKLENIVNPQTDSLRFYYLGKNWKRRVEHFGAKAGYDPEGLMLL